MLLRDLAYISILAIRDIIHERVLSFCMICSLGAIFTPMIILLGLQQGIIGNMLDTLKSDPASRLVRPKFISQSPLPQKELQAIEDAGKIFIPSSHSHLLLDIQGLGDPVNGVPALKDDPFVAKSDPVFTENKNWLVVSEPLLLKLRKKRGDTLTILLRRGVSGGDEEVKFETQISGVVPTVLMPDMKLFIPASVFNDIYRWRKGYAIPELGLQGGRRSEVVAEYDGVLTVFFSKSPKDEEYRQMLAGRLAFSTMPQAWKQEGWRNSNTEKLMLWQTINCTIDKKDIQALVNRHLDFGYFPQTIPYINDIYLANDSIDASKKWKLTILEDDISPLWQQDEVPTLFISKADKSLEGKTNVILRTGIKRNKTVIPVVLKISKYVQPGYIAANRHLAGLMRSAKRSGALYDASSASFVSNSENQIRYFRVYADSIDNLENLVELVSQIGKELGSRALKEPVSRIGDVRRIRTLSKYMEKVYLLIASISGISTIFAIAASVYATVQRRRHDLAYLNMLGVARKTIIFFPFIKSLLLISGGIIVAFAAYIAFGYLSSRWFIDLLGPTESLIRLKTEHVMLLIGAIGSLGGITSLLAASFLGRMDSKRYIHE